MKKTLTNKEGVKYFFWAVVTIGEIFLSEIWESLIQHRIQHCTYLGSQKYT